MSSEVLTLHDNHFEWQRSSQAASNLFEAGRKLWTKEDLQDIEEQLASSEKRENFTVNLISGSKGLIKNPMFGEKSPIWRPRVEYRDYWRLVKEKPEGPVEAYHCSYLVQWDNLCAYRMRGIINNSNALFRESKLAWNKSISCSLLRSQLQSVLTTGLITKIVCFGLGDMCRKPPEWMKRRNKSTELELEASFVRPSMVQHSIALTLANFCSNGAVDGVELLAQDPDYTDETKAILKEEGISVVGEFGAGGFAEIDENSVVFSAFVNAPLKQIIADIARPLLIISTGFDVLNDSEKPWADAESPRTELMWDEYDKLDFPISPEDEGLLSKLHGIYIYVKKSARHPELPD